MAEASIVIDRVTKEFRLYKEKTHSLKERVIRAGRNPYERFLALDDVSFEVPEGTTVGLLGHNGSGKSTLLKCIAGTLRPTRGSIEVRGRMAALLELGAGFHPDLTGRENVYLNGSILGFSRKEIDQIFDEIVQFSELEAFIDNQVKHYSSGMYARLAFSVAISVQPEILIIDEVLAVGDEAFARKCLDRIKQFQHEGRTILLVTHAADLVRQICDQVAVLDRGRLVTFGEPNESVRTFRETLAKRGTSLQEIGLEGKWELTQDVQFTSLDVEYPDAARPFARPGETVRIRCGWRALRPNDDVVFAIAVHDQDGMMMHSTNSELLKCPVGRIDGRGEVTFELRDLPLMDGTYPVSVGIHTRDGGTEYDHKDQLIRFDMVTDTHAVGRVLIPMQVRLDRDTGSSRGPGVASGMAFGAAVTRDAASPGTLGGEASTR
jgi:ABC-2 type transport system ATP-binding protein